VFEVALSLSSIGTPTPTSRPEGGAVTEASHRFLLHMLIAFDSGQL